MSTNLSLWKISEEQAKLNDLLFESEGELTPEMEEALAINEANLTTKAANYIEAMAMFANGEETAKAEIKRLQAFAKRCANAQERMKASLTSALDIFGIDKLEVGTHRISFRKSEAVVIDDENAIPDNYRIIEVKLNKAQIKADLKEGAIMTGAHLETRKNIQIR